MAEPDGEMRRKGERRDRRSINQRASTNSRGLNEHFYSEHTIMCTESKTTGFSSWLFRGDARPFAGYLARQNKTEPCVVCCRGGKIQEMMVCGIRASCATVQNCTLRHLLFRPALARVPMRSSHINSVMLRLRAAGISRGTSSALLCCALFLLLGFIFAGTAQADPELRPAL